MTLGQRIQELRKQKGLSQESLGEALGVSRQAVSKWEGDNGIPELDTLVAMSRLFDVTVGQLLGVEEVSRLETEPSDSKDEDRLEAILRQYAEEASSRRHEESWFTRWRMGVQSLGVISAIVLATIVVVFSVQNNSLRSTVKLLQRDVSKLQTQVSENQNTLAGTIRNTIYDVLAEEAKLLNTFDWELVDFDLKSQTATIQLNATMKEYNAGSRLQFSASWRKVDDSEGVTNSGWAEGPDFAAAITLPLNYHTDISIRVEDAEGNIREQFVDEIYRLHPDSFHLYAGNLMAPFAITTKSFGAIGTTAKAEQAFINIYSTYPTFVWPVEAVITACVNGEEVFSEKMTVAPKPNEKDQFIASVENYYYDLTLKNGDSLEVVLLVTDNLGRTEQIVGWGTVEDGHLEQQSESASHVVSADK